MFVAGQFRVFVLSGFRGILASPIQLNHESPKGRKREILQMAEMLRKLLLPATKLLSHLTDPQRLVGLGLKKIDIRGKLSLPGFILLVELLLNVVLHFDTAQYSPTKRNASSFSAIAQN